MNKWSGVVALLLVLLTTVPVSYGQTTCPADVIPQLTVGEQGRRVFGDDNNLRGTPGLDGVRLGLLPGGATFDVLAGPECADGYVWWQIDYGGTVGWAAQSDPAEEELWLEARGQIAMLTGADGIEQAFVVAPDGSSEREGCQQPPDDYARVYVGNAHLNARTLAMLDHAEELYHARGGTRDFRQAISQGSYTGGALAASFGTHDGGGAVDISVRSPVDWSVMWDEIPLMIDSLRVAGFATWLRRENQLYTGSVIHIHAIAVGDAELSDAARAQIDGPYGYLRGYNGLPPEWGGPEADEHGGPVVCQWMVAAGFPSLVDDATNG